MSASNIHNYIRSIVDGFLYAHIGKLELFSLASANPVNAESSRADDNERGDEEMGPMEVTQVLAAWTRLNASRIVPSDIRLSLNRISLGPQVIQEMAACFNQCVYKEDLCALSTLLVFLNKHLSLSPPDRAQIELSQVSNAFAPLFFESLERGEEILLTAVLITHLHAIIPANRSISPVPSPALSPSSISTAHSEDSTTKEPTSPILPNPFASNQAFADEIWTTNDALDLRTLVNLSVSSCLFDFEDPGEPSTLPSIFEESPEALRDPQRKTRASDEVLCTVVIANPASTTPERKEAIRL